MVIWEWSDKNIRSRRTVRNIEDTEFQSPFKITDEGHLSCHGQSNLFHTNLMLNYGIIDLKFSHTWQMKEWKTWYKCCNPTPHPSSKKKSSKEQRLSCVPLIHTHTATHTHRATHTLAFSEYQSSNVEVFNEIEKESKIQEAEWKREEELETRFDLDSDTDIYAKRNW